MLSFLRCIKNRLKKLKDDKKAVENFELLSECREKVEFKISKYVVENTTLELQKRQLDWKKLLDGCRAHEAFSNSIVDISENVTNLEKALNSGIRDVSQMLVLDIELTNLYHAIRRDVRDFVLIAASKRVGFMSWLEKETKSIQDKPLSSPLKMKHNLLKRIVSILADLCQTTTLEDNYRELRKQVYSLKQFLSLSSRFKKNDEYLQFRSAAGGEKIMPSAIRKISKQWHDEEKTPRKNT